MNFHKVLSVTISALAVFSLSARHTGSVFIDANGNGLRDAGEKPAANVAVSDGLNVTKTDSKGAFSLSGHEGERFIFITTPSGFKTFNAHYLPVSSDTESYDFGIIPYNAHLGKNGAHRFVQVTDSEIFNTTGNEAWVDDVRKFAASENVAFVVHTGDICYEKGLKEHIGLMNTRNMGVPVFYCIGNHDLVDGKYGEELFESIYGPVYYSFDCGNTHYVVTPMAGGDRYPGYTRNAVAQWLENDLKQVATGTPVVIFNHDILSTDSTFVYGGKEHSVDLNKHNVKANIYGHWHINLARCQGKFLTVCTSTPDKGGIDHSTACWRVVSINGKGDISLRMHYPYLHDHAVIASPKALTSSSRIIVNAYSATSSVESVKVSFKVMGRTIGKSIALSPATDWSWVAPLPEYVRTVKSKIDMTASVTFSDGHKAEAVSEFIYAPGKVTVNPGAPWTNLLGNASHTGGFSGADVDSMPALASVTNIGANIFMTSPLIADGKVFTASVDEDLRGEAAVYAVNIADGSLAWKTPVGASVKNTIAISSGKVFAQDVEGVLYAINCSDGKIIWTKQLNVRRVPALIEGLCANDSIVFAGTGHGLTAIDSRTGKILWVNDEWGQGEGTTTTVAEGNGVVVSGVQWSALYGNNASTGKKLWALSDYGLSDRGASAAIYDGLIYIISRRSVFVISADSGKIIVRKELPMKVDVTSTPLLTDKAIIFGSSADGLIALDRQTFDIIWTCPLADALIYTAPYSRPVSATVETSPILAGGRIYTAASDGTLYGIDPASGEIKWKYSTGAPMFSTPAVSGNVLVANDFGGNIYIFGSPKVKELSVLQFNIWQEGTVIPGGFDAIADEIARLEPDFVTLSEVRNYNNTRFCDRITEALRNRGKEYYSFYSSDTGLLSKYPIADSAVVFPLNNDHGTIHRLNTKIGEKEIAVYTGHLDYLNDTYYEVRGYDGNTWEKMEAPLTDVKELHRRNAISNRDEAIAAFIKDATVQAAKGAMIIFGGDFNEPSLLDWIEATRDSADHHGVVIEWENTKMLHDAGFRDSYRVLYPNPVTHPGYTYPSANPARTPESITWAKEADERDCIDYIFYLPSNGLQPVDAYVFGPEESVAYSKVVPSVSQDKFITPLGVWPTNHKGLLVKFRYLAE